jgi:hypothetical protein
MYSAESQPDQDAKQEKKRLPYEPPAIIYEGIISTRAGSSYPSAPSDSGDGVDPADLFGGK